MDVFLKVCEISIVVLQITNRQDFLISYDTYMSTPKWICKLQITSRVKGTWRRKWRHCYRYIPYDRTIMELDPTGKEVFWFFFYNNFYNKNEKKSLHVVSKINLILVVRTSLREIHFYMIVSRKKNVFCGYILLLVIFT